MNSLRAIARSVPRATSRLAVQTARKPSLLSRSQASWRIPTSTRLAASFSTSQRLRQANEELVAKLEYELQTENENKDQGSYAAENIKEYLDNSPFSLEDKEGSEEVVLRRKYNDEDIEVKFSTADLTASVEEQDEVDDQAMFDEEDAREIQSSQSGGANTKGAVNQGKTSGGNIKVAPEDRIAPADRPELADEEGMGDEEGRQGMSFPVRVNVRVARQGKGAMVIEAVAQDGDMVIDNVFWYPDTALADGKTAEQDWKKRSIYAGPSFGNLDEDLQVLLERYLEERGVDTKMALFLPDYIEYKENEEYIRWLGSTYIHHFYYGTR